MQPKQTPPQRLWFKRRRYGWGWMPVTWEGWLVTVIFLVTVLIAALRLSPAYLLPVIVVETACLLLVCFAKGPTPRWRMGKRPTDNPDEDW